MVGAYGLVDEFVRVGLVKFTPLVPILAPPHPLGREAEEDEAGDQPRERVHCSGVRSRLTELDNRSLDIGHLVRTEGWATGHFIYESFHLAGLDFLIAQTRGTL